MADIEKWITINGVHIPIIKGESKAKAVSNFIKGERAKRNKKAKMVKVEGYKYPIEADYEERLDKYKKIQKDANKRYDKREITKEQRNRIINLAHDKYIKQQRTITGRAKTTEELRKEYTQAIKQYERARKGDNISKFAKISTKKHDIEQELAKRGWGKEPTYKMKTLTPREKRIAERENIRGKLKDANTIYADGKKFEKVTNGKHNFTEYKSGGINWGEDTLINRIQNSKKVKYKK